MSERVVYVMQARRADGCTYLVRGRAFGRAVVAFLAGGGLDLDAQIERSALADGPFPADAAPVKWSLVVLGRILDAMAAPGRVIVPAFYGEGRPRA